MSILNPIISFVTTYSVDVAIMAGVLIFLFWYGLWYEKYRLTSLVLSFYVSALLFKIFPFFESISIFQNEKNALYAEAGLFLVFVIFSIFVLNRVIKGRFPASGISRWFNIGILALSGTGLLLSISANLFPAGELYTFAEPVAFLFASAKALFYWMITPLVVLFFISRPVI